MNILFIHNNFPAQFKFLVPALLQQGHHVQALCYEGNQKKLPDEINSIFWQAIEKNNLSHDSWLSDFETKLIRGRSALQTLKEKIKVKPDLIISHVGWGETLFLKDHWPNIQIIGLFEFYYHVRGQDIGFDLEFPSDPDDAGRVRLKNINALLMLTQVDLGFCATHYQKSLHPPEFHHKLRVIHEGIDTDTLIPQADVKLTLSTGKVLTSKDEIITFVNRNLEPYRGYHRFIQALPEILKQRPNAHVFIIGGEQAGYGSLPPEGQTWKQLYWEGVEKKLDTTRVHFTGRLPYTQFIALLQISQAHIYFTYPFILSWSMLEAMSCGALVIASDTEPVTEVIQNGKNGLLVNFFDAKALINQLNAVFEHPDRMKNIRLAARKTIVEQYDLKRVCLPKQLKMISDVIK